jgi:hypothetical protein
MEVSGQLDGKPISRLQKEAVGNHCTGLDAGGNNFVTDVY